MVLFRPTLGLMCIYSCIHIHIREYKYVTMLLWFLKFTSTIEATTKVQWKVPLQIRHRDEKRDKKPRETHPFMNKW